MDESVDGNVDGPLLVFVLVFVWVDWLVGCVG